METCKRRPGRRHPQYSRALLSIARLLFQEGRFEEAYAFYKKAVGVQTRVLGEADVAVAATLMEAADCEVRALASRRARRAKVTRRVYPV